MPQGPPQVRITRRIAAKSIDLFLAFALAVVLPYQLGAVLGFVYSIVADGLSFGPLKGQSIGKKLMKLRVIQLPGCNPCSLRASVLRNAPVGIATFFGIIPLWGWLLLGLLGVPLMLMETYLMVSVTNGHRLGDVMGDTEVIFEI